LFEAGSRYMSRGINKAVIVGTLGWDPEIRYSSKGSDRYTTEIVANEMQMLGRRSEQAS